MIESPANKNSKEIKMPAYSSYCEDVDDRILKLLPNETESKDVWLSINDITSKWWLSAKRGTVQNSFKRLCDCHMVIREWDGNERYGRYIYAKVDR
jgi:predicted transcriptional regulator